MWKRFIFEPVQIVGGILQHVCGEHIDYLVSHSVRSAGCRPSLSAAKRHRKRVKTVSKMLKNIDISYQIDTILILFLWLHAMGFIHPAAAS